MANKKNMFSDDQLLELKNFIARLDISKIEFIRAQAVLMNERNLDFAFIEEYFKVKRSTVFKWRSRFIKHGVATFIIKKAKPKALLNKAQRDEIITILKAKNPTDFGYNTEFWNTKVLGAIIKERFNVEYKSSKPFYLLFEQSNFSYHKPGQKYHNRKQELIDSWLQKHSPIIQAHMNDKNTVVITEDEMILSTKTTFQKVWIPKGYYPKIDVSNARAIRIIFGFLNLKTGTQHAFKDTLLNSESTCAIVEKLCDLYQGKHIVLIWDNAPWHRSAKMREWLEINKNKYNITLIQFPPYAPELNPQEHVWKAGRSQTSHNKFIANIDIATDEFIDYLNQNKFNYMLPNSLRLQE